MSRILAVDFGQKRSGIAVTDPLQIIANGLAMISSHEIWKFLDDYLKKEAIETIVVGYPLQMDGSGSNSLRYINPFIAKLVKTYPNVRVVQFDERFTSKIAQRAMIDGGMKKKDRQNKGMVDQISAVIILQDYLQSRK